MPESSSLSFHLSNLTGLNQSLATEASNISTLSALLSLKGWSDLNPRLQALDEAEHKQQLALKNALSLYGEEPTQEHEKRLLNVLMEEQARLTIQKEAAQRRQETYQAEAELAHQQTRSYNFLSLWQWVSDGLQGFLGSSPEALAEHYAMIAKQREERLKQLNKGIDLLRQEFASFELSTLETTKTVLPNPSAFSELSSSKPQEDQVIEPERLPQEDTTEHCSSPTSRHLLQQSAGLRVVKPVPNQVIPIGQPYTYSMSGVFTSDNPFVLGVAQIGQSALPSWLSFQPVLLSTYPAGSGQALGVAVSGSTVFVANEINLQVLDASNPENLTLLSIYSAKSGRVSGVAVSGSTVFVAAWSNLQVLDASNPKNLTLLSTYPAGSGRANGVAVSGSTVFVADYNTGLQVLDASNPKNLTLLSTYPAGSGQAFGVAVSGSTVFVANAIELQVLDTSNPRNLTLLSTYPAGSGQAYGVTVSGSTVFVADLSAGLQVLDASDLRNLTLLSTYPAGFGQVWSVSISGSTVFVMDGTDGLQVLDASNLRNLSLLSTYPAGYLGEALGTAVSGSMVFVADLNVGLQVLDISQSGLTGLSPLSSLSGEQLTLTVSARDLVTNEYLTLSFTLTLDNFPILPQTTVSDQSIFPNQPLSLFLSTNLFTSSTPLGLFLSLQTQKGGAKPSWLTLIPNLQSLSTYPAGSALGVTVSGSTVFVADDTAGLQVLNASNPKNLSLLSTYSTRSGRARGVSVSGSTVFIAADTAGLQVLNASNPNHLTLLSIYPAHSGQACGVAVSGSIVFVADGIVGLQVLDASNPKKLSLLSTYPAGSGQALGVAVSGSTIFVANDIAGLYVLDASNPRNLTLLSTYYGVGLAWDVAVSETMVFVADMSDLKVLNASNPRNLTLLSTYSMGSQAQGIAVSGSTVFVADGRIGLQVLDASNPRNLTLLSSYPAGSGQAMGVTVSGSTIFVANYNAGLQVLDMSQQTLMATPSQGDAGNYKLALVATDIYGGNISAPFTIRIESPPQIHDRIPLQYALVSQVFTYFVPQNLITDPNKDPISFSAELTSNLSLPSWLSFNPLAAIFMGAPGVSDGGTFNISLSSTDNIAGFTNTSFILFVGQPIPTSAPLYQGRFFNFSIPSFVFNVSGIVLSNYTALQSDRSALPSWLQFNTSQLLFEGIPPADDQAAYTLHLMVVASNELGDKIQAPLSFQIIPNAFFQISPPSIQTATTGTDFRFVANTIFNRPNGYSLVYSASQADGRVLPSWLSFNATEPPMFYGKPGYSDTDFYAVRLLQIRFNASDGMVNGTSLLTIGVGGSSWGQFAILVASPIVSFLAALYSLYKLRGFVLNRCAKQRYQKGTIEIEEGETFRLTLKTSCDEISEVAVRLPAKQTCSPCCRFFKLPQTLSGNSLLPSWLLYDPEKREIRTKRTIPAGTVNKRFVIQVCNEDKVILEEYTLKVVPKLAHDINRQVRDEPEDTVLDNKTKKRTTTNQSYTQNRKNSLSLVSRSSVFSSLNQRLLDDNPGQVDELQLSKSSLNFGGVTNEPES